MDAKRLEGLAKLLSLDVVTFFNHPAPRNRWGSVRKPAVSFQAKDTGRNCALYQGQSSE